MSGQDKRSPFDDALYGKRVIFAVMAVLWLALDQMTKLAFAAFHPGDVIYASKLGFLDIILVHNTGAAWGAFAGAPGVLGIISVVVCAAILIYALFFAKGLSALQAAALGLVFAGGVGNAIDRFWHGYVIDFLSTAFMDFPVFNVADIGVTVGVILFIVALFREGRGGAHDEANEPRGNA